MFHARDCKTGSLFDKWAHMGPKRRKLLDDSWAGFFRREILPELPVEKIAPAFDEAFGRPTKEMYTTLGALIFQQMLDLDDEETIRQLAFSIEWHYALDLDGESDAAKYICPRTLWTMRGILIEKKLDTVLFSQITDKLARVFSVDTRNQRLDSVHIESNIAYSDAIRPPFRGQTGHCSDVNPATIPRGIRPVFRADSGHFSWVGRN
ncbi:transposase, partial [Candidatus Poribacteria bacterium]|nr:transposase [Candidatus Poribacteria bacterium]